MLKPRAIHCQAAARRWASVGPATTKRSGFPIAMEPWRRLRAQLPGWSNTRDAARMASVAPGLGDLPWGWRTGAAVPSLALCEATRVKLSAVATEAQGWWKVTATSTGLGPGWRRRSKAVSPVTKAVTNGAGGTRNRPRSATTSTTPPGRLKTFLTLRVTAPPTAATLDDTGS